MLSQLKIVTIFHTDFWNFDFDGAIDSSSDDVASDDFVDGEGILVVHLHRESRIQTEIVLCFLQVSAGNVEHLDLDRFLAAVLQVNDKVDCVNVEQTNLKKKNLLDPSKERV
jgi:hypothetical protein